MKIHVNRDSVCAGDDVDSRARVLEIPDETDVERVLTSVLSSFGLPSIQGGRATWCVNSGRPIAVVAQQWAMPKLLPWRPSRIEACERKEGIPSLYFTYLVQHDPDVAFDILRRLTRW
jgi:hypothetical protein